MCTPEHALPHYTLEPTVPSNSPQTPKGLSEVPVGRQSEEKPDGGQDPHKVTGQIDLCDMLMDLHRLIS